MLAKARESSDLAKRQTLYAQAERVLLDAAPCIPFYIYDISDLVHPWVKGFRTRAVSAASGELGAANIGGLHPFRGLWIERE